MKSLMITLSGRTGVFILMESYIPLLRETYVSYVVQKAGVTVRPVFLNHIGYRAHRFHIECYFV